MLLPAPAVSKTLTLQSASAPPAGSITIPVMIDAAADVLAADVTLSYDPDVLTATGASITSLTTGFSVAYSVGRGEVSVSMAASNPISSGSGALVNITFSVAATAPSGQSDITISKAALFDTDFESASVLAVGNTGEVTIFIDTANSLTFQLPDTLQPGDSVTFNTNGFTSNGDVYYRYDIIPDYGTESYDPITNWQMLQDFTPTGTVVHTFIQPGNYIVIARISSFQTLQQGVATLIGGSIAVGDGGPVHVTGLSIDASDTIQVNQTVTFTATATHSANGTIFYRFHLVPNYGTDSYEPFSNWEVLQDASTSNSCSTTFTQPGSYVVVVFVSDTQAAPDSDTPIIGAVITVER
nr:cohesin domain-containing protein [uncultured Desulfobacter sp.]